MTTKPRVTKNDIHNCLVGLGLNRGDLVEVHSSLSAFGYVEGGADAVIDAVLETIGAAGTVIMPGSSEFNVDHPLSAFDVDRSPIMKCLGIIPETLRRREGTLRSVHPKYSWIAAGAAATWFMDGIDEPMLACGKDQPLYKVYEARARGRVLMLGVDLRTNSLIHVSEEIAQVPYLKDKIAVSQLRVREFYGLSLAERQRVLAQHNTGPRRDFSRFDDLFRERGIMKLGKVGAAVVRLIKAREMVEISSEFLKRHPFFLVVR